MKLWQRALGRVEDEKRDGMSLSEAFTFLGQQYGLGLNQTWSAGDTEPPPNSFDGYDRLMRSSPVVWSAVNIRRAVFSQARFKYRQLSDGKIFGDPSLRPLERPWPGGTSSNLLGRMLVHADAGGNAFPHRTAAGHILLLNPGWCTIVLGSELEPDDPGIAEDAVFVGVLYYPGGPAKGRKPRMYFPGEVAHFAPYPDPSAHYRGMSPITPVIRDIQGDKAFTEHKLTYLDNAATPNLAIKFDASVTVEAVKAFKELFEEEHRGAANAFKTLFLGGGADPTTIGAHLKDLDYSQVQGKAETRILMALGVHPTLAGASEGLQGSSLNAGNFGQARRIFSDVHLQDLWSEAAASLESLVRAKPGTELAMDGRHIPFLQDDQKDQAEIQASQAQAARTYVDGGFDPASVIAAIAANDMSLLKHTGLVSVQLQPPGTTQGDA